jgi:hypothetical protein
MKRIAFSLLVGLALVAMLVPAASPRPVLAVAIGGHDITFISHTYDPGTDISRWTYNVTSAYRPALSHWVIAWCGDCTDFVGASEEKVRCGLDPISGIKGIKFDKEYDAGESRVVWFELRGDHPEGLVEVATFGGPPPGDRGEVTGPLCVEAPVAMTLVLLPDTATNPVDTNHELTATVYDQFGNVMEGVAVTWTILSGPGSFVSQETTTDSDGKARAVITSSVAGITTVKCEVADDTSVFDTATKTWTTEAPVAMTLVLLPDTATNPVDTNHELTATVYDQFGNVMEGVAVTWTILSGPGSFVSQETTTDSDGKARAVITSSVAGTTTVKCEVADDTSVFDTATKTWTTEAPVAMTLVLLPETATNPVDTNHELTATVYDQFGNVMEGVAVTWTILSGPGSFVSQETTTDSDGKARAVITSSVAGITTVKCEVADDTSVFDTATKTWTTEAPVAMTLVLLPETATNPVDTNHELTATVYDQFGNVMEGVAVTWTILSGPGSFVSQETTTDSDGKARAVITSSVAGTTTVKCEVADDTSVFDTATKTWTTEAPVAMTLVLLPETATNPVDTNHELTATVYDQFGNVMEGVAVTWTILSGPGSFVSQETTTDSDGKARAVITSSVAGITTVKCEVADDTSVFDTATKTWTTEAPVAMTLVLLPETATNPVDTNHELTATVYDQFGNVMEGVAVTWTILSGPGSFVSQETTTDSDGKARAVITSSVAGITTVRCEVADDTSVFDTATKTWTTEAPVAMTLVLLPDTATNPVDTNHELTATVYDQFGNVMEGVAVTWTILSGPGSFVSQETTTDSDGKARAVITSSVAGTTTVKCEVADDTSVFDTATKTWTTEAPVAMTLVLLPETATNPVDTNHELTATVYDQFGNVMEGVAVTWTILSGPGSFVSQETTTDSDGKARAVITSSVAGITTVKCEVADDTSVFDTATKTWTTEAPVAMTLVLLPETATNPVDTNHELTATVYDQFGNVMEGVAVTWTILSGPGSFVSQETTTDSDGKARAVITSSVAGTTTVKCEVADDTSVFDTATKTWTTEAPAGAGGGGIGCPRAMYLTVDWEENITSKHLLSNHRLAANLLGPSPDGKHSLLLERWTLAPQVDGKTHYRIVVRELELEQTPALPEQTTAIVAFEITPAGAEFDKDIFLTFGFDRLPDNAIEDTLTVAYYDAINGTWQSMASEAGEPNGVAELTLTAALNHFSIYGVLVELAPPPPAIPATFIASNLNIQAGVEKIWEPVTFMTRTGRSAAISANIANQGGQSGTYVAELKLNGEGVDSRTVTLGPGQSQVVTFTLFNMDYGQYEVEVSDLSGTLTTSRTINWWLIIVIVAGVGLISWAVAYARRRRRAEQQSESEIAAQQARLSHSNPHPIYYVF